MGCLLVSSPLDAFFCFLNSLSWSTLLQSHVHSLYYIFGNRDFSALFSFKLKNFQLSPDMPYISYHGKWLRTSSCKHDYGKAWNKQRSWLSNHWKWRWDAMIMVKFWFFLLLFLDLLPYLVNWILHLSNTYIED